MKQSLFIFTILTTLSLMTILPSTGCASKQGSSADFESSQMAAKANAQKNGDNYMQANNMEETAVFDTDTSISRRFLKGDGYASAYLMLNGKPTGKRMWCGTLKGRGCKLTPPSQDGTPDPKLDHKTPIQK